MAVFLAIGGLLAGSLYNALFSGHSAGMTQVSRVSEREAFISEANGAEIDSAALIPQSAPFLASADNGPVSVQAPQNADVLYGAGALRDPEQATKSKTSAGTALSKSLASGVIYKVANGDTPASIATLFGIPLDTIEEFNPSVNFSALVAGISIVIPAPGAVSPLQG